MFLFSSSVGLAATGTLLFRGKGEKQQQQLGTKRAGQAGDLGPAEGWREQIQSRGKGRQRAGILHVKLIISVPQQKVSHNKLVFFFKKRCGLLQEK